MNHQQHFSVVQEKSQDHGCTPIHHIHHHFPSLSPRCHLPIPHHFQPTASHTLPSSTAGPVQPTTSHQQRPESLPIKPAFQHLHASAHALLTSSFTPHLPHSISQMHTTPDKVHVLAHPVAIDTASLTPNPASKVHADHFPLPTPLLTQRSTRATVCVSEPLRRRQRKFELRKTESDTE